MVINTERNDSKLTIILNGHLDNNAYDSLTDLITNSLTDITELVLDFKNVDYVTSSGLRCLLRAQNVMDKQGKLLVMNTSQEVQDQLDCTGFSVFMDIE